MSTSLLSPSSSLRSTPPRGRGWAGAGVLAAVAGIVGIVASTTVTAVYRDDLAGDAPAIQAALGEQVARVLVFHVATMLCVLLLPVFAAGLRRHLAARLPQDTLLPEVAAAGLLLVSVAGLVGTGLTTEFVMPPADPTLVVPEASVVYGHWMGTVPWLWAGAGISGLAVAAAVLRHGAGPRWAGWLGGGLAAVTALLAVSPLQYMAGMTGPLWLLLTSMVLLASGRPDEHDRRAS